MSKSKWLIVLVVAVVIGAVFVLFHNNGAIQKNTSVTDKSSIVIGALLPLSGEAASYGEDCRKGIELAFMGARKKLGQPVKVVFGDTKADPKTAIAAFNKVVDIDKADVVIGGMFSSTTLAIAPLAQQRKILLLSPTSGDERVAATGNFIFSIYPSASWEGAFMAARIKQDELERVVVLYQDQSAAKSIAESFSVGIKKRGGKISLMESISEDRLGYRSLINKVASLHPTAIYISAYRDPVAQLIILAREAGIKSHFFSQSSLFDEKVLSDYAGKLNGVTFSGPFFSAESKRTIVAQFLAKYQAKYHEKPSVWSAYGYDAAKIIIDALYLTKTEGGSIQDKLPGMAYNGLTGKTKIGKDRSVEKGMTLYTIKENKFIAQ